MICQNASRRSVPHTMRCVRGKGFTLIELLVVIAIMSLLAAITVAAVGRVRSAQQVRTTEQILVKLQIPLDTQWSAVVARCQQDQVKNKIPQQVVTLCENDMDRASALWMYANLKREFPQTFLEARTAINLNGYVLQPRQTFASVPNVDSGDATGEAAALLYLILSENASGGVQFAADDVLSGSKMEISVGSATGSYSVFKDPYGRPITFVRFFQHAEVDAAPFVNANDLSKISAGATTITIDPLDPRAKLKNNWTTAANRTNALNALNTAGPAVAFDGRNKLITVISSGPNKQFEMDPLGTTDDVYGYRLRRQGAQGS